MLVRRRASTVVVLGMLLLVGCAGEPAVFAPSAPPSSSPPASDEELAFRAAEETYRAYVDALNEVDLADPRTFEPVFALTTGPLLEESNRSLKEMHSNGWTVEGRSVVVTIASQPSQDQRATMAVCLDVSAVLVRDAAGSIVTSQNRNPIQSLSVVATADGTRIEEVSSRDGDPQC